MIQYLKNLSVRFNINFYFTCALIIIGIINFIAYTRSERKIDRLHDQHYQFRILGDELRASSDELTRMVRTFAITKAPEYEKHYQTIIAIREGRTPPLSKEGHLYWDIILGDTKRSPVPLETHLEAESFTNKLLKFNLTQEEVLKLESAKKYSDELALLELKVIDIIKSPTSSEDQRRNAILLLHNKDYHQQKSMIMQSINEFYDLVEKRISNELDQAVSQTFVLRNFFYTISFLILLASLNALRLLRRICGAPPEAIHSFLFLPLKKGAEIKKSAVYKNEDSIAKWIEDAYHEIHVQKEKAENLLLEKNRILGVISHDLRSPISRIQGFCEVLSEENLSDESRKLLGYISSSTDTAFVLLADLLDFAQVDDPKFSIQKKPTSLTSLLKMQIHLHEQDIKRKEMSFILNSSEDFFAAIDEGRMNQVLSNLITNSIKYSPPKSQITLELKRTETTISISITDEGQGISNEEQKRLFQPFQVLSSKPTGGETQTGLGLYICKRIIDAHEGHIQVKSELGRGSTFVISLTI